MLASAARVSLPRVSLDVTCPGRHVLPIFSSKSAGSTQQFSIFSRQRKHRQSPQTSAATLIALRTYATEAAIPAVKTTAKPATAKNTRKARTTKAKKASGTKIAGAKTKKTKVAKKPKKKAKKKVVKKAKKKAVKKRLTPEEKTKKWVQTARKEALKIPHRLPYTAYAVVLAEVAKANKSLAGGSARDRYKALSPEEMEHYNRLAHANQQKNQQAYRAWVESHSVEEIYKANLARTRLRQYKKKSGNKKRVIAPLKIADHRQAAKRPSTGFFLFMAEKRSAGDFDNLSVVEAAKLGGKEWRELSEATKKEYYKPA